MTHQEQRQRDTSVPVNIHKTFGKEEVRSIDFVEMLRILYPERALVLKIAACVLILFSITAFLIKPRYTAMVSFVPPSSTGSSSAAALAGQLSSALGLGASMGGMKSPGDLYVGILKSRTISALMVKQFDLKSVYKLRKESLAEKELASNTTFEVGIKDTIVSINVTDKSPERARDMANSYLTALKATSDGLALTESSQRRLFYEERIAREKNDLADAEVALKETQERTGLIAPAGQTFTEIQALAQLRAQIVGREVQLAALRQNETDQNPDVIRLRSEIGSLQSQIGDMETGKKSGLHGDFSTAQMPTAALDYIRKARDVKYHETLFEILAKQYEAARLDEANSAPLQILDRATLPDSKSGPARMLIVAAGLIVGTILGCCWVLLHSHPALKRFIEAIRSV